MSNRAETIDLHIHTTVSDGTDSPQKLLKLVRAAGFTVFSVTDHDAITAAGIIRAMCAPEDPVFIPGIEFSCKDTFGKYHILGYGFDPDAPAILNVLLRGQSLRQKKTQARLELLQEEFGYSFPEEEIRKLLSMKNPGKPHIANLMVGLGYAESIGEAIDNYIDRVHVRVDNISPQEAIAGILGSGGIPVLAHPLFGAGSDRFTDDEMERRLRRLTTCGLQGVEAFYSGFSAEQTGSMLALAEKYDLYVTAGSDYHGKNKKISLGQTGLDKASEYPDGLKRFLGVFGI